MSQAGTQEALKAAWSELADILDLEEHASSDDQLLRNLANCYQCFGIKGGACDSSVRTIFTDHLQALDRLGIPREFLLQCVRVGAVAEFMRSVESCPSESVSQASIFGREGESALDDDGFGWANDLLHKMEHEKKEAAAAAERQRVEEVLRRKEEALARISEHMHEPDFSLTEDERELLKPEFQVRLRGLRALIQNSRIAPVVRKFHSGEYANQEITSELFEAFKNAIMTARAPREISPDVFEVMNPEGPFFYVAIKNRCTTFREFISNLHNNLNIWFEL